MSQEPQRTEFAEHELQKAREALSDARTLREAGGSTAGTVNRIYYSAFHAARAVLSVRGTVPDDEDDVPSRFVEDVVIPEEKSMEEAQFLNQMRAYRQKADFEHEPVDVDLDAKIARGERFVEEMAEFC